MTMMIDVKINSFSDWLAYMLHQRHINQSELAHMSGVSRQAISNYISGRIQKPDEFALKGIARALKLPLETVYQVAGVLPAKGDNDYKELAFLYEQMTEDEREEFLEWGRAYLEIKQRRSQRQAKATT